MRTYRKDIQKVYKLEEIIWCQQASTKWLKESDANIAYIHRIANMRHKINAIPSMNTPEEGTIVGDDIKTHIHEHF